jgi:hypothetical protein
MATCIPFLKVAEINKTIDWYESIGFVCTGTNQKWEPGCEINWAELAWQGASFMIGPDIRTTSGEIKDASMWFNVKSLDEISEALHAKGIETETEEASFFGMKVISFMDLNGYHVSFGQDLENGVK